MKSKNVVALVGWLAVAGAQADKAGLDGTFGIGVGGGVQRYLGSFGDQGVPFGRFQATYNPLNWLGARMAAGYGDLSNDGQSPRKNWETDGLAWIGTDLVVQPPVGVSWMRPYLASGIATMFGSSKLNGKVNHDLDWNAYAPLELGVEFALGGGWWVGLWAETYIHARDWDVLDGAQSRGDYFQKRDELQRAGFGIVKRFGGPGGKAPHASPEPARTAKRIQPSLTDSAVAPEPSAPVAPLTDSAIVVRMMAQADSVKAARLAQARLAKSKIDTTKDSDRDGIPDAWDSCPKTPKMVRVMANGCPFDVDQDGIPDYRDSCRFNPARAKVDAKGCPIDVDKDGVVDNADKCLDTPEGGLVGPDGCLLDTDKDGVPDYLDRCEATPAGAMVSPKGCVIPPDTDRDGVLDPRDECPDTPGGTKVDIDGCQVIELAKGAKVVLHGLRFETDADARLDSSGIAVLWHAAGAIQQAKKLQIEIVAFVEPGKKLAASKALAQRRAEAVKAYLVRMKVSPKRIVATGVVLPKSSAKSARSEARAENRRVELRAK